MRMNADREHLPLFLKQYFWDVPLTQVHLKRSQRFVLERILEYGDPQAVRWMQACFDARTIRDTIARSTQLSARSANLWAIMYRLTRTQVRCLSSAFQKRRRQHWVA